MGGTSPAMTSELGQVATQVAGTRRRHKQVAWWHRSPLAVMAGAGDEALLRADVPAIHVLLAGCTRRRHDELRGRLVYPGWPSRHGTSDEALLRADVPAIRVL